MEQEVEAEGLEEGLLGYMSITCVFPNPDSNRNGSEDQAQRIGSDGDASTETAGPTQGRPPPAS